MTLPFHLTRPLTVFDLETTHRNAAIARIVEIHITQFKPGGDVINWGTRINPGIPIPATATAIHGITDADVADKPKWETLAAGVKRAMTNVDFCGYNLRYDMEVLTSEYTRIGMNADVPEGVEPPRIVDPHRLWQVKEPRTLDAAHERWCQATRTDSHGAAADVQACIDVLRGQFVQWPDLPRTVEALHALAFPPNEHACDVAGKIVWEGSFAALSFGKHEGVDLARVPRDYLKWLVSTEQPPDTRALLVRALTEREFPTGPRV